MLKNLLADELSLLLVIGSGIHSDIYFFLLPEIYRLSRIVNVSFQAENTICDGLLVTLLLGVDPTQSYEEITALSKI